MGCWEKLGSPKIVNQRTLAAAKAASKVYEHHAAGGGLHCLLDDWNLEDAFCQRYTGNDHEKTQEEIDTEEICAALFSCLSIEERASALAIHDGFFHA